MFKITGIFVERLDPVKGTSKAGKDWEKQDFVIETQEKYPKTICFTLFGNKIPLLNQGIVKGVEVEVLFDVQSREYNGKYYHNINAQNIQVIENMAGEAGIIEDKPEDDNLPF